MAKSSMGAARMRQTNRRIQHQEKAIRETAAREHRQHIRQIAKAPPPSAIRQIVSRISKWFSGLFSGDLKAISALDFRIDRGDRGRGARQLRAIFGQNLKMRSTRDGRPV